MHAYTLRCMIIRWREWSSDRHGGREPDRAGATMPLTRLSLFPYAGELTHTRRSVHSAPSRQVMKELRRTLSPRL